MKPRYVLDTHCWLWWNADPDRLSAQARALVADGSHDILLSAASAWEIAIKHALGKLTLPEPPARCVPSRLDANRIAALPIQLRHTLEVSAMPQHHRDAFDRLIIAQALCDGRTVVTADRRFERYGVPVLWAVN
ncbi:MAG TPA: type II toxin-antitoxin system VapC family toxin [Gammaproteobacteria bacterium]|nr:type II toxin-antitoxin system VapC family toxin [Gammaproteobacteria bacterium]